MSLYPNTISEISTTTRLAQILAITGVSIQTGIHIGTSLVSVPSLLTAPSPSLAQQWQVMYDCGLKLVAPIAITSAASFAYLAYTTPSEAKFLTRMYGAAAVTALAFVPFTRLVMGTNIDTLQGLAKGTQTTDVQRGEVVKLVQRWSNLNFIRGFMPLTALVLGTLGVSYHV